MSRDKEAKAISGCKEILKLASAAAAIAVSRKGAALSILDKNEVLSYFKY